MSDLIDDRAAPLVTDAPDEIWLCYGDVFETQTHAYLNDQGVVLWCEDKQDDADVRYVRDDALEAQAKRIAELEAQQYRCIRCMDWCSDSYCPDCGRGHADKVAQLEAQVKALEVERGTQQVQIGMLEASNEGAAKIENMLRQRLQDVRMYLLEEADKHTPCDPVLNEAYQMTQRHLEWCPAARKESNES